MATNNYTSRTAALKATKIDSRLINAKTVDASSIVLEGKNIKESFGFQSSEDFKKLYQRSDLDALDTNYTLYTDGGNPVYVKEMSGSIYRDFMYQSDINSVENLDFSEVTDAESAFEECENLIEFEGDLSKANNTNSMFYGCKSLRSFKNTKPFIESRSGNVLRASYMFAGCESLTSFEGEFRVAETNGLPVQSHAMFTGCKLDLPSFSYILNKAKEGIFEDEVFTEDTLITIGVDSFLKNDVTANETIGPVLKKTEEDGNVVYIETTLADLDTDYIHVDINGKKYRTILEWNNNDEVIDSSFNDKTNIIKNGFKIFRGNKNLTSFTASLDALEKANNMFSLCTNLTSFSGSMPKLEEDFSSFSGCTSLVEFDSEIPSLAISDATFQNCTKLIRFASDVSNLAWAHSTFRDCSSLTIFFKDLPNLQNGTSMFERCSSLTTFTSPTLKSLKFGENMFRGCKLSAASVEHILNQIKTVNEIEQDYDSDGNPYIHYLTIGIDKSLQTDEALHQIMGIEIGTTTITTQNKNGVTWEITIEFN